MTKNGKRKNGKTAVFLYIISLSSQNKYYKGDVMKNKKKSKTTTASKRASNNAKDCQ